MVLLQVQDLCFYWRKQGIVGRERKVSALKNVCFELEKGETLGVVGPSGSGKTTLVRLLHGELSADFGRMLWKGCPLTGDLRRRVMSRVYQNPWTSLNPYLTVARALSEPLRFGRLGPLNRGERQRILSYLEMVQLPETFIDRAIFTLSGGERQRVAIARALIHEPQLVLCDEPTSALDEVTAQRILKLFCDLKERGMTFLFVTHDLESLVGLVDRVMVMDQGKVCEVAATDRLFTSPEQGVTKALLEARLPWIS